MRLEFDDFTIESDEQNYTLNRKGVRGKDAKDAGAVYESVIGYYGTLQSAFKGYLKHSLRRNTGAVKTVEDLINRLEALDKKIDENLAKVKRGK